MAHVVMQGRRLALAGTLVAALLLLCGEPAAWAAEDDIVPGGTWLLLVNVTQETQQAAIARDAASHPLVQYLLPVSVHPWEVRGDVVRRVVQADLLLGFGITDTWNLNLSAPYRAIQQESNLATDSTDPRVTNVVDGLRTRTVSGMGNVRLTSLHRPLFSDTDAIVLSWGVMFPGGPPQSDYIGQTTLDVGVPYSALTSAFQYTRHLLSLNRARIDMRGSFDLGFDAHVKTPTEKQVLLHPPNVAEVLLNWEQEFETIGYGLFITQRTTTQAFLGDGALRDPSKQLRVGGQVTYGNLSALEAHPIPLPYQMGFRMDRLVLGFNVPDAARYTLFLRTYF